MSNVFKDKTPYYNRLNMDKGNIDDVLNKKVIKYTHGTVFVKPECIFHINNNFKYNNDDERFKLKGLAIGGSIMVIDGKPKSRKTTLAFMMMSAALSHDGSYENIHCTLDPNNHVMVFDTEMMPHEFLTKMESLKKWSRNDQIDHQFHGYCLSQLGNDPEMKIQAINKYVYELDGSYRRNGVIDPRDQIGMIVIDNIGDLVNNKNNIEEINDLIGYFSTMAIKIGCLIICIVHQNKNNNEATGSLGYEFTKKMSAHIKTFKKKTGGSDDDEDNDMSMPTEVSFYDNRFGSSKFKRFIFDYDDYGFPVVLDHKSIQYNFGG